jgi:hypothetical protein
LTVGAATVPAAVTVSVKDVVLLVAPPAAVTVTGKVPAGVDVLLAIVRTVEHAGRQETAENEPVAPEGSPETANETVWVLPVLRLAVTVFAAEDPALTETLPELAMSKLNAGGAPALANHTLASSLG